MNIKLHTIKVKQPIGQLYITKISGKLLYQMAKADIMKIAKEEDRKENEKLKDKQLYEGIQRKLNENKVKSIEGYLTAYDATFPTSIILNINKDKLVSLSENEMIITESESTFSIIDGQHRLQGFRNYKNNQEFEVIVSIYINLNREQQSRIFTTINSEHTKVDPSISFYLEKNDTSYTPRKIAAQIAATFNIDTKSPWKGKIKLLGTKDDYSNDGIISLSAFAKPILDNIYPDEDFYKIRNELKEINSENVVDVLQLFNYDKGKYIFWELYASQYDKVIYKILFNYFMSLKKVFNKDWGNPKGLLTKTTGYNAIMALLKVLYKIGYYKGDFSEEFFYSYIIKLKSLDGKINSTNYGASGLKASNELYYEFLKLLNLELANKNK
ncbi:DGQHR domain-containing protein [Fictibacillus terranigra]|uniref:DGQHR domain-containing protein n=1 Tax=Fictibacillus terranigra TaxID=3058424 RepID=A0ABT8EAH9_9BACL|nr:DGQHR domain-containing protein [Fictibacillus sp. CENA-BCM004]MDN4074925.1 DGQHR domain-containing protein [Fictibacillus sp. CENA-BCM004]